MLNNTRRHKVIFKGSLEKYGEFMVAGETAAKCIGIIAMQIPELERDIKNGYFRIRQTCEGREDYLSIDECKETLPRDKSQTIEVIPVIIGAGGLSPEWKVVIGVVLIIAACTIAYFCPPAAPLLATMGVNLMLGVGVALAAVGIMELTAPEPDPERGQSQQYSLSGPQNVAKQNIPVQLIYGRCGVGSVIIESKVLAPFRGTRELPFTDQGYGSWTSHTVGKGQSNAAYISTMYVTDLLGEGPIVGLVNSEKSVYLDRLPLVNTDGSKRFPRTNYTLHTGANNPKKQVGATVSQAFAVKKQVNIGAPVYATITDPEVDSVIVNLYWPQFTDINGKGNQTRGCVRIAVSIGDGKGQEEYAPFWIESDREDCYTYTTSCYDDYGGGGDMDGWGGHSAGDGWGE